MKIFSLSLLFLFFISCGSDSQINNCFQNFNFTDVVNLNNAEFVNIQVPGGHSKTTLQGRRILIIRRTSTEYKVFDLECPERNCAAPMDFDGLKLICSCHNKEYNSLNGSPIDGDGCLALEYIITNIGNNSLQISR